MLIFKEFFPHISSIHHEDKPAFSVIILMPKKNIPVLIKKENNSAGENYYYSFSIGLAEQTGFKKPENEKRKKYDGFLGMNKKEIVHFIIPADNQGANVNDHSHLHIKNIQHSDASVQKSLLAHDGTIHFPGEAGS